MRLSMLLAGVSFLSIAWSAASLADWTGPQTFEFREAAAAGFGNKAVTPGMTYDAARGYGWDDAGHARIESDPREAAAGRSAAAGEGSMLFSVKVPEGNYRVTATLGSPTADSDTAIKTESRRVMWPLTKVAAGQTETAEFTVNVRTPKISDTESVHLQPRENIGAVRHWDDKLTLEFCGKHPAIESLKIERVDDAITVYLAGDSTVTDQPEEPWAAWGQLLPQFFKSHVAIANYAESGRTFKSFTAEKRWNKIKSVLKPGDYVFIQFGHNDMKEKGEGIGPYTSFSDSMRGFIKDTRAAGAFPVVCTPMHRRKFIGNEIQPTFGDYPDAIRKVAAESGTPLIDLQVMSKPLYEHFGPEDSKKLFVWFKAGTYPGQKADLKDDTHFQAFGADQIARCVVQGIRDLKLPLASELRDGIPTYDPAHPGDPAAYDLPASHAEAAAMPEGK